MSTYGKIKLIALKILGCFALLYVLLFIFGLIEEERFRLISWVPFFGLLIFIAPASKEDLERDKEGWEIYKKTGMPAWPRRGGPIARWFARGCMAVVFIMILVVELNAFFTK